MKVKPMPWILAFVLLLPVVVFGQEEKKKDVRGPLEFFVGAWEGEREGRMGASKVDREYRFVLNDKFLEMKNKSTYEPQEDNPKGEVHEDWAFFSYDQGREKFVFRQFHVEGFVNQYVSASLSADGKMFVFFTEAIENISPGWRARETYRILNDDEFTETFQLAPPKQEFELHTTNHFKRKR